MTTTYIIPVMYIHNRLNVNENTNDKILKRSILEAQELDLMGILGEDLYDKIISDINGQLLAGDYLQLVNEYIAPFLSYAAYYRALLSGSFKFANGNLYRSESENGIEVDSSYLRWIMNEHKSSRDTYSHRLNEWLCANTGKFPEYRTNDYGKVRSKSSTLFGGISLTNYGKIEPEKDPTK